MFFHMIFFFFYPHKYFELGGMINVCPASAIDGEICDVSFLRHCLDEISQHLYDNSLLVLSVHTKFSNFDPIPGHGSIKSV